MIKEALAKIFNSVTGGLLEAGIKIIDKAVSDKDLKAKLEAEWRALVTTQQFELEAKAIELEQAVQVEQQRTFQAELNQADLYTKRTRPKIARQSWYVSLAYAAVSIVSRLTVALPDIEFDWEIFIPMASPALTYMGVRSLDLWKRGGAKTI